MAVAVDATGTADVATASGTSATFANITVGSGLNRALVVLLTFDTGATGVSVHWDSAGTNQAMSQIAVDANNLTYLFGLVAPTPGAKTLTVSWSGGGSQGSYIDAISFTGVNQTGGATSFAHAATSTSTSTAASVPVTSAVGNWVVAAFETSGAITSFGQTQIYNDISLRTVTGAGSQITGAASVNMTAVVSPSSFWAAVGCDVVAAGGGGDTFGPSMKLLMM